MTKSVTFFVHFEDLLRSSHWFNRYPVRGWISEIYGRFSVLNVAVLRRCLWGLPSRFLEAPKLVEIPKNNPNFARNYRSDISDWTLEWSSRMVSSWAPSDIRTCPCLRAENRSNYVNQVAMVLTVETENKADHWQFFVVIKDCQNSDSNHEGVAEVSQTSEDSRRGSSISQATQNRNWEGDSISSSSAGEHVTV